MRILASQIAKREAKIALFAEEHGCRLRYYKRRILRDL